MILDKAYSLKLIKQLTEAVEALFLGSPDKNLMRKDLDVDSLLADIFGLNYNEVKSLSNDDLILLIEKQDEKAQPSIYQMFGNLFYYDVKEENKTELTEKAKLMYQKYLEKSGVFSLPIVNRMGSL